MFQIKVVHLIEYYKIGIDKKILGQNSKTLTLNLIGNVNKLNISGLQL